MIFWGIEDKLKIKGQGDILESSARMFAQKMTVLHSETDEIVAEYGKVKSLIRIEPAERMPIFCMFAVYEEDCNTNDNGELEINLSEEKKQTIRKHFPNADAVVVIPNPEKFIEDVNESIGFDIKVGSVQYYHIDKGCSTSEGKAAIDMEFMKYLTQDVQPVQENGTTSYIFYADYAYRVLFCKDIFLLVSKNIVSFFLLRQLIKEEVIR